MLRVLAINGSLRTGSHNGALLRAAGALLPSGVELVELTGLAHLPAYSQDHDVSPPPATVAALRDALAAADAVLISTPEYNSSIPGALKNALDWASRPFPENALRAKPAVVIGASTGMFGAVWAQGELRKVLHTIGAHVVDRELPVPFAHERFDERGRLIDDLLRQELADLLAQQVVRQPAVRVEALMRKRHGQLAVDDVSADRVQDLAQLSLRPHGAEHAGARSDDGGGLPRSALAGNGREAQSSAFLSCPGIDELYSGVLMRTASAEASAPRSAATVAGGGLTSWSSL